MRAAWVAFVLVSAASTSELRAEHLPLTSRSQNFKPEELGKALARGELALVESKSDGTLQQIVVFTKIQAPIESVYQKIYDVASYPKFLKSIKETQVIKQQRGMLSYRWVLDLPVFDLKGTRMMRGQEPRLIEVRGLEGAFRKSSERFELYSIDSGKATVVALYRALDFETGGVIVRAFAEREPYMKQSLSLSMSLVHVRALKRHLEGLGDEESVKPDGRPFVYEPLTEERWQAFRPLFRFGEVVLVDSAENGQLERASALAEISATREKVEAIVKKPEEYSQFVPNLSDQKVTAIGKNRLRIEYELDFPITDVDGTAEMEFLPDQSVKMIATGGDITNGYWHWSYVPLGEEKTLLIHTAGFDVTKASWLVRRMVEKQPLIAHGLVAASVTLATRAIKERAEGRR